MGVTIHYRLGIQKGYLKGILDRTEALARNYRLLAETIGTTFQVRRPDAYSLLVDIGGCETLAFEFLPFKEWDEMAKGGWQYEKAVLEELPMGKLIGNEEHLARWPEQRIYWAAAFCKTQYAGKVAEHRFAAELVRSVSAYADYAEVTDEGDYYHTGRIEDAAEAIESLGTMINALGATLSASLAKDGVQVVAGGKTEIKSRKKKA